MTEIEKIKTLIQKLNDATRAYDEGKPYMSDKAWDKMYFELKEFEQLTGIIYPNSPTQTVVFQKVSQLNKVAHNHLMLSLDKTKDITEVKNFLAGDNWLAMFKMDGLTCSLTYKYGVLIRAETRGDGHVGEDVLHNITIVSNIPKTIPITEEIIIDGEIICNYKDFEQFKADYKNPRNFAAGSIRLLDSKECVNRKLQFIAWDLIKGCEDIDYFMWRLEKLDDWGFDTVPRVGDAETVEDAIHILDNMRDGKDAYKASEYQNYPIDGYVFKFDSRSYGEKLGHTAHHFRNAISYKFYDEEYETKLVDIEWSMGRTGVLTPIAVIEPIEIEGTIVSRASLSNISIMEQTLGQHPFEGQTVYVTKRNQIIPKIEYALNENGIRI